MNVPDRNRAADAADTILRVLARRAVGLSGADIERLVREARQTARRERRGLLWSDLEGRLTASRPVKPESLRWRTALHEAGHAIARFVLGLGTITLITIDGPGGGGMVHSEELGPVHETEEWISSLLIVKLAGRAAEEIFLGSCIAGSGGSPDSDLARATALALQMEVAFGFGAKMPLLYRNADMHGPILLSRPDVAQRVNDRLEKAYEAAKELIRDHQTPLQSLVHELLIHDTLEGEHLVRVLATVCGSMRHGSRGHREERLTAETRTRKSTSCQVRGRCCSTWFGGRWSRSADAHASQIAVHQPVLTTRTNPFGAGRGGAPSEIVETGKESLDEGFDKTRQGVNCGYRTRTRIDKSIVCVKDS